MKWVLIFIYIQVIYMIECKEMVMKFHIEPGLRMKKRSENFNKDLENLRKTESELKNIIIEIKNTLECVNSRLDDTGEWINDLEQWKITQSEEKKEERNFLKFKRV